MTSAARLLADLIGESAAGVRAAEREMAHATVELERTLDLPPESLVDDAEVDAYLVELFPDPAEPTRTFLRSGNVYPPAAVETFRDLGVDTATYTNPVAFEMPFSDKQLAYHTADEQLFVESSVPHLTTAVEREVEIPVLTEQVVDRIRRAAAFELGCDRRDALRGLLARGVPSAVTETMDVDLKVAFDEDLTVTVPNYREADVGLRPEAIGTIRAHMRFEREG